MLSGLMALCLDLEKWLCMQTNTFVLAKDEVNDHKDINFLTMCLTFQHPFLLHENSH